MKFSIIVPVYNVYKYLKKCLDSITNQSYDNYEVIIVNDGSPDNSQEIIDEFVTKNKKFKCYKKKNGGLSSARNYGLKKATGDYILFLDSDDYIERDLLKKLAEAISKGNADVIRFECNVVDENGKIIRKDIADEYIMQDINEIIENHIRKDFVEASCFYCYKKDFWNKNKFEFAEGKLHEDTGLIPYVLYRANKISAIPYHGYNYVQRDGSITKSNNIEKDVKKANDVIDQYEVIVEKIKNDKTSLKKKVILTYLTECTIIKTCYLTDCNYKNAKDRLNKISAKKYYYAYNFKKIIKKIIILISFKMYFKVFCKGR